MLLPTKVFLIFALPLDKSFLVFKVIIAVEDGIKNIHFYKLSSCFPSHFSADNIAHN